MRPVIILPAMAEQLFGVAKGTPNFICIELSNGIGASLCCNGMTVAGMCMHYVKDIATRMGLVIANAVNMLNPELIVLYGFKLQLGDFNKKGI